MYNTENKQLVSSGQHIEDFNARNIRNGLPQMVDLQFYSSDRPLYALVSPLYPQQGFRVARFEGMFLFYRSDECSRLS